MGGLLSLGRSWRCRVLRVVLTVKAHGVESHLLTRAVLEPVSRLCVSLSAVLVTEVVGCST
jgi:hypothetical protein